MRIANPSELERMSWHQRDRYRKALRAYLENERIKQREFNQRELRMLRAIIADLARAMTEHDKAATAASMAKQAATRAANTAPSRKAA